jgi:uncharacterized protein
VTRQTLTLAEARELAVEGSLLSGRQPTPDADGMLAVVQRLGGLQIDPTRTVEKTHLLVLWSRIGTYDRVLLDRLLWQERRLFEYNAFILPIERLPEARFLMAHFATGSGAWQARVRDWMTANRAFRRATLARLRSEGPLPSRALDADAIATGWKSSGWTNDRNVTQMLEFMSYRGEVAVAGRKGNQRLWDLPEKVLPADAPADDLSPPEFARRRLLSAVRLLGVASSRELQQRVPHVPAAAVRGVMADLAAEGRLVPISIGRPGEPAVDAWTHSRATAAGGGRRETQTTLVSPFDPLIKDRERTERLFGFRYRLEMYVPPEKREFGKFVLPVLHDNSLIGRVAPVMDRRAGVLRIEGVFHERGAKAGAHAEAAVAGAVDRLAEFLGATSVEYVEPISPD